MRQKAKCGARKMPKIQKTPRRQTNIDGALRTELERALAVGDRASNAVLQEHEGHWTVQGDPTEGALLVAARKAGLEKEALDARFERVGEIPFSSQRKLMTNDPYRCRCSDA